MVYGPAMLRSAELRDSTLHLTGDVTVETGVEVWGPRGIAEVTWNGEPVPTYVGRARSRVMEGLMPAVRAVALPALDDWRCRTENPESDPEFDDSAWTVAGRTTSHSTTPVPEGGPVLFADDHGFHHGDVWYRGRLEDLGGIRSVALSYSTGTQGLLMAWLDGRPLGTHRMPAPDEDTAARGTWTATARFDVPRAVQTPGEHVLSVLVRPMQHAGTEPGEDAHKAARGLVAVEFAGGDRGVEWRVRGATDPERVTGPFNNGGLYGERRGWHLPDHDDRRWRVVEFPREERRQGVTWYRTRFRLGRPNWTRRSGSPWRTTRSAPTGCRSSSTAGTWASTSTTSARSTPSPCRTASCAPAAPTPWRWWCWPTGPPRRGRGRSR